MTTQAQTITREDLTFCALDGYPLAATLYHAPNPQARLLVAGATGVPQRFYRRFAEYAAQQGYTTMTLDYRGIGKSKPDTLRGFDMHYLDWAQLDLAAAVEQHSHSQLPLFMVGHSFGGHAFGLLPNHQQVKGFCTFGTGAGWHGWMPKSEQLRVLAMWHVIAPLLTRIKGYMAWSKLGMGEDLPMGVYTHWKKWCRYPRYFFDDPDMPELAERFARVTTPIVAVNATDDLWAPPASRDAFMTGYSSAPYQPRTIEATRRQGRIGHMGYFRPSSQGLWDDALNGFASLQRQSGGDSNTS